MVLDACINLTENLKIFVKKAHISKDNLKLNIYLFLKRTIIFAAKIKHYYYCLISWNIPSSYDIKSYEEDNNWVLICKYFPWSKRDKKTCRQYYNQESICIHFILSSCLILQWWQQEKGSCETMLFNVYCDCNKI